MATKPESPSKTHAKPPHQSVKDQKNLTSHEETSDNNKPVSSPHLFRRNNDNTKIREKLRSLNERRASRGPILGRPVLSPANSTSTLSSTPNHTSNKECTTDDSACQGNQGRKSRNSSPPFRHSDRQSPSPNRFDEAIKKRIEKACSARFYLLQQPGPHSFLVGTDPASSATKNTKYKVIIGPQTCTCKETFPCVHLLFVMVRVLKVSEADSMLLRNLRNYEVDTLVRRYRERKNARLNSSSSCDSKEKEMTEFKESMHFIPIRADNDENCCSICLSEMRDGQTFSVCNAGCLNSFHKHCISIWFEECRNQNEQLTCPLCRQVWDQLSVRSPPPAVSHVNQGAPTLPARNQHRRGLPPTSGTLNPSYRPTTSASVASSSTGQASSTQSGHSTRTDYTSWQTFLGRSVTDDLFSQAWDKRESGLRQVAQLAIRAAVEGRESMSSLDHCPLIREAFRVVCRLLDDDIYNVFVAALRAFREILGYLVCNCVEEQRCVQRLIAPVLRRLLRISSDSQSKKAQLALSALVELARGQNGELAVGREVKKDSLGIGGVEHLASFILMSSQFHPDHLLGRLLLLGKLLDECEVTWGQLKPALTFASRHIRSDDHSQHQNTQHSFSPAAGMLVSSGTTGLGHSPQPLNTSTSTKVSRQAKRVFLTAARQLLNHPTDRPAQHQQGEAVVERLLSSMEQNLQERMRRKLNLQSPTTTQSSISHHEEPARVSNESSNHVPLLARSLSVVGAGSTSTRLRSFVRLTPEPAYDAVAPSESGLYSTEGVAPGESRGSQRYHQLSDVTESVTFRGEVIPDLYESAASEADSAYSVDHGNKEKTASRASLRRSSEELLEETDEALSTAMRIQTRQNPLPLIPGLSLSGMDDRELILGDSESYAEKVDWSKGPLLGTGAFSYCYQARDFRTGTLMAVKQIRTARSTESESQEVLEAVQSEVCLMARLSHHNIARLLGAVYNAKEGIVHVFVEWMPGGSVQSLLARYGAFQETVVCSYTYQVVKGLCYLHENQILHRDLKGANLLVNSTGTQVRISDFGASARLASTGSGGGQFQGQLLGTIAFMAPEVLRGEDYGRSCDIWSVGCIVIEMLTTKPPWNDKHLSNHLALMFTITTSSESPVFPSTTSLPLRSLLESCLDLKPSSRPNAQELLQHPVFDTYSVTDESITPTPEDII